MKRSRFKKGKRYRKRRTIIILAFISIVLFASANIVISKYKSPMSTDEPNPSDSTAPDYQSGSTQTPVTVPPQGIVTEDHGFLPYIGSVEESGLVDELKSKVQEFISGQSSKYGVHFIDLATGESFGINDRDSFVAASTSKLPMNLLLYTKIESGEIDPEMVLKYKEEHFEPGSGIIQKSDFGTEYTVRKTSELSIVYSDNCGINMIIEILGIENICQYILDLGGEIYYDDGHRTSARDLALVTQELYRLYLQNPDLYGELIYNLENTQWNDRINALLPENVKVAHKIGNQDAYDTFNDVGIVFASHPYALAVMCENTDYESACEGIGKLSKIIYDEVEAYSSK